MSKIEVNAIEPQSGTTLTIGASGDTIALASGATATGFSRTGTVNWDTTAKTTGFTAVSGVGYFCNTTSSAFTVTLPLSPSAGAIVGISDYANTFATNNLTVGRNGSNIGGIAGNATLSTNGIAVTFVYVDATQGWIVTDSGNRSDLPTPQFVAATGGTILTCGDFKTHVFTGPGTFTVSSAGNSVGSNSVEYLIVAGGGGGGKGNPSDAGGGGGAGGYRQNYPSPTTAGLSVTATAYPITVGSGGAGSSTVQTRATSGNTSIFSTITSAGGGGGGTINGGGCIPSYNPGASGGSGGGGAGGGCAGQGAGGTGNTPPTSPSQGNNGGDRSNLPSGATNYNGGGGGGAGAAGNNGTPTVVANGGIGSPIATTFFGPTSPSYGTPGPAPGRYFAGGGGVSGTPARGYPTTGTGGNGGGGAGGIPVGVAGTVNTGGGGGSGTCGASGGSGIVIIRYKFQ